MEFKNFTPKKRLGQNFLKNPRVIQKIIETAELTGKELVVEVGPGLGILTEALLKTAHKVIAIEKDKRLFMSLQGLFCHCERQVAPSGALIISLAEARPKRSNLELIHGDALKIPPPKTPYILIANIPYYITSPLLDHFIRNNPQHLPQRAVLMVQKEVAQKICAQPPHMNVLALHVQTFGIPQIISYISRRNFQPIPKVDSAIIKIEFDRCNLEHLLEIHNLKKYFNLIHRAFSQKRKMLRATLPSALLKKACVDETRRPETLTITEWARLAAA